MSEPKRSSGSEPTSGTKAVIDPEIGRRIVTARKRLKISAQDLGEHLGVSKAAISAWERGLSGISPRHVAALSIALDVPVEFLMTLPKGTIAVTDEERAMLELFRKLSPERRAALLTVL